MSDWFKNNVKVDGFEGELSINVSSIEINKIIKEEYYRFEISLSIEFLETNETLNKRKLYKIGVIMRLFYFLYLCLLVVVPAQQLEV